MKREELVAALETVKKLRAAATDDEALEIEHLFPLWHSDEDYVAGDRVRWNGKLWKCITSHTSQTGWSPDEAPALWVEIAAPGEYREIKEGMLPTEAFALDEIGWWKVKTDLYRSKIPANTYTPESYPAGWEAVE